MIILRFLMEWLLSFFVIWGLFWVSIRMFSKKWNPITSAIFSFMVVGLGIFLTFSYVLKSVSPSYIYMPIFLFWFIYYLYRAHQQMSE